MSAAQTANASPKPAANAAAGQDAAAQAAAPETQPSRGRRLWAWLKCGPGAALQCCKRILAGAKALMPGRKKAAAGTAEDEAAADASEDRREPVLADGAVLAVLQGLGGKQKAEARRAGSDAASAHAEDAPAAPPKPLRRLTMGHVYAALAGLVLGVIVGASLFWNLALVQSKRMQRAYSRAEASIEEIRRLKEDIAEAEQKLAEAGKQAAKRTPVRPAAETAGSDATCELSGKRSEVIEELRACLKEFTRSSR